METLQPPLSAASAASRGSIGHALPAPSRQRRPAILRAALATAHGDRRFAESFLGRLPRRVRCSQNLRTACKEIFTSELKLDLAATCPWIATDSAMVRNALLFDLDHDDGFELVATLPTLIRPTLIIDPWSGRSHAVLMLRTPVLTGPGSREKARALANIAHRLMATALRATPLPQGALIKNPVAGAESFSGQLIRRSPHPTSGAIWDAWQAANSRSAWFTIPGVEAGELRDVVAALGDEYPEALATLSRPAWHATKHRGEPSALGRNCRLFDLLRWWSYDRAERDGGKILTEALRVNASFTDPLPRAEVEATARSIARFMRSRWRPGSPAAERHRRDHHLVADLPTVERQRIAGRVTAQNRAATTKARIFAAAEALRQRGAALTKTALAVEAGVSARTVQRHWRSPLEPDGGETHAAYQVLPRQGDPREQLGENPSPIEQPPSLEALPNPANSSSTLEEASTAARGGSCGAPAGPASAISVGGAQDRSIPVLHPPGGGHRTGGFGTRHRHPQRQRVESRRAARHLISPSGASSRNKRHRALARSRWRRGRRIRAPTTVR